MQFFLYLQILIYCNTEYICIYYLCTLYSIGILCTVHCLYCSTLYLSLSLSSHSLFLSFSLSLSQTVYLLDPPSIIYTAYMKELISDSKKLKIEAWVLYESNTILCIVYTVQCTVYTIQYTYINVENTTVPVCVHYIDQSAQYI